MKASPGIPLLATLFLFTAIAHAQSDDVAFSRIRRTPVESTNVASVGYSRQLHALEIEFTRGAIYRFLNVPPSVHRELLAAGSKGHFIAENVRGRYRFVRVLPKRARSSERIEQGR